MNDLKIILGLISKQRYSLIDIATIAGVVGSVNHGRWLWALLILFVGAAAQVAASMAAARA